jgi:Protein of unknwon function (DUF3310)
MGKRAKMTGCKQICGTHYSKLAIQPTEYIIANNLGWFEGNIVKYITRWKDKGGEQDLDKVIDYVQTLKSKLKRSEALIDAGDCHFHRK